MGIIKEARGQREKFQSDEMCLPLSENSHYAPSKTVMIHHYLSRAVDTKQKRGY
jgi:hypothetical protein